MRDNHRPKQELVHEITGLRKQVSDLKEAIAARRRVEDALRDTSGSPPSAFRQRTGRFRAVPHRRHLARRQPAICLYAGLPVPR